MKGNVHPTKIWAIVPAAGMGRRAGGPKQTFALGDSTLAGTTVQALLETDIAAVIVVTRTSLIAALRLPRDPRVDIAINDVEDSQMIDSVRIGLRRIVEHCGDSPPQQVRTDGVMVLPSDMPGVSPQALKRCMTAFRSVTDRIVMATHATKSGHPIIFPLSMQAIVENLDGGLNMLRRRFPDRVVPVEVDEPGILSDIDTLDDYERWKKRDD